MAFDLSTAKPVGGFDISTAKPVTLDEPQPQALPEGNALDSVIEPLQTIGSGIGRTVAGGLLGIKESLDPRTAPGAGAQAVSESQNLIYQPETQAGTQGLQNVNNLVELAANKFNVPIALAAGISEILAGGDIKEGEKTAIDVVKGGLGKTVGDKAFNLAQDLGASPEVSATVGALGQVLPEGIAEAATLKGGGALLRGSDSFTPPTKLSPFIDEGTGLPTKAFDKALASKGLTIDNVDDLDFLPDNVTPKNAVDLIIKKKLQEGASDDALAPFQLSGKGRVESDLLADDVVRQGFEPAQVQSVKVANESTRQRMGSMIDVQRRRNVDSSLKERPSNIAGNAVMARYKHIRSASNEAASDLDRIAKTELKGKQIDLDSIEENFLSEMDRLDVAVDRSGSVPKLNFEGSQIAKDPQSQKIINDIVDLLGYKSEPNALRAHKLKRQIDSLINSKQVSSEGITPKGQAVAVSVRKSLNDSIRSVSDEYGEVNDILSQSIDAMDEFQRVVGRNTKLGADSADSAVGTRLRRLLSNVASRDELIDAIDQLDGVSRNLGGKFDDDVNALVNFAHTLDDRFGAAAKTSLKGEVAGAMKQASRGKEGATEAIFDKAGEAVENARGINDKQAMLTLEALVRRKK